MSKESFRVQLMNDIHRRFRALDMLDYSELFHMDDTFRLALCIAFMTLSKESIIVKDKKNTDRLGRLTKQVSDMEIDTMFQGEDQPIIHSSLESDHTWILDNIRDSILHEHFDIDEEHRKIIIHNTKYGRGLDAEIPFDWFFRYVEQGIYNQRYTDYYTMKGFYYDREQNNPFDHPSFERKDHKRIKSYFAVHNHILYRVNLRGEHIPVDAIESRIRELFDYFAKIELSEGEKEKYGSKMYRGAPRKFLYNRDYLTSFIRTKDYVENIIRSEYPGITINIQMDPKKDRYIRKMHKSYHNSYRNYDDVYQKLCQMVLNKKDSILKIIDRFYDASKTNPQSFNQTELQEYLVQLVLGDDYSFSNDASSNYEDVMHAKLALKDVFFQIYGLCILSMNKSAFHNPETLSMIERNMTGYSKDALNEYLIKRRKLVHSILDSVIKIDETEEHLAKCPPTVKEVLESRRDAFIQERDQAYSDFQQLDVLNHMKPDQDGVRTHQDWNAHLLEDIIEKYMKSFMQVSPDKKDNGVPVRKTIRSIIYSLLDRLDELQRNYFLYECDPKETLEMIRNSFSHVGRVKVTDYFFSKEANVFLNDYDEQGNISGVVQTTYSGLLQFLYNGISGYEEEKDDKKEEEKINLFD